MTKKNIAILCTSTSMGGLEFNTIKLAAWLREKGWKTTLLIRPENPLIGKIQSANIPYYYLPPADGNREHWKRAGEVANWLKDNDTQLLFTPFNKDLRAASICKRYYRKNLKLVYQQHMKVGVSKRDFVHSRRYGALDSWISPLPYLKEETLRLTTVKAEKIAVIPFGLEDSELLVPSMSMSDARKELNLPEDGAVLGILGRIDKQKGHDTALAAVQNWNSKNPTKPFHLLIVGDASLDEEGKAYKQDLEKRISVDKLADSVTMLPYSKSKAAFFAAIDVFIIPSVGETFGMVTLEAMAAGVPVLGSNSDGTKALLEDGKLGYLFEPGNENDFCMVLEQLLADPQLLDKLELAQKTAREQYSKAAMMDKMDGLLTKLLSSGA